MKITADLDWRAVAGLGESGSEAVTPAATKARRAALVLSSDEIHVWRAHLDAPSPAAVAALHALLSADEVERARKFYFERDRRRFVVGRGILRKLLGAYVGLAPAQIAFRYGANGKPALAASTVSLFFNLAHSEDLALYAFTRAGEVGIDVERVREMPDWPSIAELTFSPEELERLRACPTGRRREQFFHAWTRQEALLKAAGTGLPGAPAGRAHPRDVAGGTPAAAGLHVFPLTVDPGFAAALAVQRPRPTSDFS